MKTPAIIEHRYNTGPNGWTLEYPVYGEEGQVGEVDVQPHTPPTGGLIVRNVKHQGFSFAKEMRVVGLWVFPADPDRFKPKFLVLGPPDFLPQPLAKHYPGMPYLPEVPKADRAKAPRQFEAYNVISELQARYESREPLFEDDQGRSGRLEVTQQYLFTDYSDRPAHEPTGGLLASRFFPLLTFKYLNDDGLNDGYVGAIRVDYYFHLRLEGHHDLNSPENMAISHHHYKSHPYPNQAGVFRDADQLNQIRGRELLNILNPTNPDIVQAAFAAVEKPLKREIASIGLKRGSKYLSASPISTNAFDKSREDENDVYPPDAEGWDNIHWWGSRGIAQPIISAIGAFHAVHLHWRWTLLLRKFPPLSYSQFPSYSPQFMGHEPEILGGPLLDPEIPDQTIRFTIAKYRKDRDPNCSDLRKLSKEHFSQLFHQNNSPPPEKVDQQNPAQPDPYNEGANLVLWYSNEVFTPNPPPDPQKAFGGTLMIHGMYFAHEPEPLEWLIPELRYGPGLLTGSRTPEHWGVTSPPDYWLRL